jgi:hypothetical protein
MRYAEYALSTDFGRVPPSLKALLIQFGFSVEALEPGQAGTFKFAYPLKIVVGSSSERSP